MRRIHVQTLRPGLLTPEPAQARHLRNVLRLSPGDTVEAFDNRGSTAVARVEVVAPEMVLSVVDVVAPTSTGPTITVAAAVPKGDRADWMIEKLSELGVASYVPLRTARSVVHPNGRGKVERWERIAVEAAKQSRRVGVLHIAPLTDLVTFVTEAATSTTIYCGTGRQTPSLADVATAADHSNLLIGPESGWSADEEADFAARGLLAASLGPTILRVETAAVVAAALITLLTSRRP